MKRGWLEPWPQARRRAGLATCLALAATSAIASSMPDGAAPPNQPPDIVGEAIDPGTGNTLYLEHHYCKEDALICKVFYLRPNEELIASKSINYQPSLQAPELRFRDFRTDRELSVSPLDAGEVVDAGFDNFVRMQWQQLARGEEVTFPFRVAGRDKPIPMRASRETDCENGKLCLEINLDSWLLSKFVDPIELTYDEQSRRLLRFEGISNLKTDSGRTQQVMIRYRYFEEGSSDAETASAGDPVPAPVPGGDKVQS